MAQRERGDTGERLTKRISVYVTPSLYGKLKADAEASGARWLNAYINELLEDRAARRVIVAGTTRNPTGDALRRELHAIGINYNQLAKYRHSTGEREREPGEEDEIESLLKQALRRVIAL